MKAWKKGAIIGLICLVLVSISIPVGASTFPSNETLQQWEGFKTKYGESWQVKWHSDRDAPRWIYGSKHPTRINKINNKDIADEIAKEIITDTELLLKANPSTLKIHRIRNDTEGWLVDYDQYFDSVPVYRGKIRIILTNDGELNGIINDFYSDITVPTQPKITQEEAVAIARGETGAPETAKPHNVTLTILPMGEDSSLKYYLAWHVQIWATDVFVDAVNGDVVWQFSVVPSSPAPQTPEPTVTTPPETTETPTYQPEITETPVITTRPPIQQPVNNESVKDVQGRPSVNAGVILVLILIGVVGLVLLKRRGNR